MFTSLLQQRSAATIAAQCQWGSKHTEICLINERIAATHVFPLAIEPGVFRTKVFFKILFPTIKTTTHDLRYHTEFPKHIGTQSPHDSLTFAFSPRLFDGLRRSWRCRPLSETTLVRHNNKSQTGFHSENDDNTKQQRLIVF